MQLGTEIGLGPGDIVLVWEPVPPRKGAQKTPPLSRFMDGRRQGCVRINPGLCLLWPNGWMDQDATWHGDRPGSLLLGRTPILGA